MKTQVEGFILPHNIATIDYLINKYPKIFKGIPSFMLYSDERFQVVLTGSPGIPLYMDVYPIEHFFLGMYSTN